MALAESFSNPLSVELLDTARCQALSAQINDFENAVFGPDFYCDFETIRPWVESGSLFYSAVCGEAVAGRRQVFSVVSALLTSEASRDKLLAGQIADYELSPWPLCPEDTPPVIYFASVISDNAQHLSVMYDSLADDMERYLQSAGLCVTSGFSIAAGPAGLRHLSRSGFTAVEGRKYLEKYDLMVIDGLTAKTEFWLRLFRVRRRTPGDAPGPAQTIVPPYSESTASDLEDAHQVEKRLALSKANRYRILNTL